MKDLNESPDFVFAVRVSSGLYIGFPALSRCQSSGLSPSGGTPQLPQEEPTLTGPPGGHQVKKSLCSAKLAPDRNFLDLKSAAPGPPEVRKKFLLVQKLVWVGFLSLATRRILNSA